MSCIKTGADVWLQSHDMAVHGDLFQVENAFILNLGAPLEDCAGSRGKPEASVSLVVFGTMWTAIGSRVIAVPSYLCSRFVYHPIPANILVNCL